MNMRPVQSSHIHSVGHDPETNTLAVQFHKGGVYHYEGVSKRTFDDFCSHESPGKFFRGNIHKQYNGKKA